MFLRIFSCFLLLSTVFAVNFPGRLSAKEAAEHKESCGRRYRSPDIYWEDKSFGSRLTNRTEAPWVTSSGTLISKRHILTCSHCVPKMAQSSHPHYNAIFVTTCTGKNRFMNCTEKPLLEVKVVGISYLKADTEDRFMHIKSDIAILTLEKDIESSKLIYPACLGGYPVDKDEPIVEYGYGWSPVGDLKRGIDQANFLQTFTVKRFDNAERDMPLVRGVEPTPKAHGQPGDSGSGYIHKKNGVVSIYAVHGGAANAAQYGRVTWTTRVSPHIHWISAVTGIEAKDEDMEFTGYFYLLKFKDNRIKKTFFAGASHPSRVVDYSNKKFINLKKKFINLFIYHPSRPY